MIYNIGLFAIWLLFVGDITTPHLIIGILLVLVVRIATNYMNINISCHFPWLIKEILFSTIAVVKIIWSPKMSINPVFEHITTMQQTGAGMVLYANSITLTPGTYTVDIEGRKLFVHSLVKQDSWPQQMDLKIMETIKC